MCWKADLIDNREISGHLLDAAGKNKLQSLKELV